ncbi:MAG TPA: adenylate/guanylate cyclase domain-containing protein, partial [Ilumatobacter sp.]|nr:adenylate/guanylate cyclase domain-containing protein [Ilumatobacter sp.]
PRIALEWVADTPHDRWRLVTGSMVFADISGFTALSERLAMRGRIGAEELVETLTRVFGAMLDTADSRGGQMLKFGGDALLFLFDGEDHVDQACSTAVAMRSELRRASDTVTSVGRLSLSVSIGVHSGEFHLFLVGEPHRELVVAGPGTTEVILCENSASAGEIVVSAATAALLPARATRRREDGVRLLRWRTASVEPHARTRTRSTDRAAAERLVPAVLRSVVDGARPDPAHRVATLSFMRFSGIDEVLATEGPDELAARLHETLRIAQRAFDAEDIALLCVDCDADAGKLFCSAGVPVTSEDDEGRMLRAARAIVDSRPPLPLQIGINRGHVFAAEIGTPRRSAYSAMGDTTNTAARICGKAPQGSVYVHPAVLEHARTRYESTPVGPFEFKGKTQPQILYEVGDELGQRAPDAQRDDVPFLGRDDEVTRLRSELVRARDGAGGCVVVTGAVGVGKSRLVREAMRGVDDVAVVAVRAEPYGATSAYRMFRDPVRSMLGVQRAPQPAMASALRDAVDRLAPSLLPLLALVGDVAHVDIDPSPAVQAILPRYRPARTADVVIDLLDARFAGPLVITVEDGHWADDASVQLVERLVTAATVRPWAVVVTRRGEPGGVDPADAVQLELGPLDDATIRELTFAATDAAPLRPHEVDQIVRRSGGNPLFVEELLRAVAELGSLDSVPSSLQGAMAAQVDALDPHAKRVLSYASVLGRSFRRAVLSEVLRAEHIHVDEVTIERLAAFLEADGADRWRFRNGLIRDVTYDGLGYRLRARLHLEAGDSVERISPDRGVDAAMLALHFAEGGDHGRAFEYATVAAERAERSHATSEAIRHLERALGAARRLAPVPDQELRQLWIRLGDARDQAGLLEGALDAYRQAARFDADPVAQAELRLRRARVRERAGSFSAALREATIVRRRLAERSDADASSARSRAASFAAVVRQRQERAADALRLAEAAAAEAERCGDRSALARAHGVMAWAGLVLGRGDSMEHTRRALELFEEVGDLAGQAHMANNLGGYTYFRGEWDETLAWYARCEEACRRTGNVTDAALTIANTGEVLVNQGRLAEAEPLLRDAARVLRVSKHLWGATFAEMHLGRLLVARGALEPAERLLRACVDDNARMGSSASAYESALHLGGCLVAAGRPAEALELIERTRRASADDVSIFEAAHSLVEASALLAMGRVDAAVARIVDGVAVARQRTLEFDLSRLLALAARSVPIDPELLGTDDPLGEARRLARRLGVIDA